MNPAPDTVVQSASRSLRERLRLYPLAALMVCSLVALALGLVNDRSQATGTRPAPAPAPAEAGEPGAAAARATRDVCTPGYDNGVDGEPWRGARRARSEQKLQARLADEHPSYVNGRGGFKFFRDQQSMNFSQALGREVQSASERKAWVRFFKRSQAAARKQGADFHIVVAPAEWDVYRQQLPAWAAKLRGTTTLDTLMAAHPDLPWIDTRGALRAAAAKHATFEPLNTHWTPYGGYVAWKAISACLRQDPEYKAVKAPPLKKVKKVANLNEFAPYGVPDGAPARTVPVYRAKHPATVIRSIQTGEVIPNVPDDSLDLVYTPAQTRTRGALTKATALIMRDSTGSALSPHWSWAFAKTIQYSHGLNGPWPTAPIPQLVKKYRPDVVFYVITERYLSIAPLS